MIKKAVLPALLVVIIVISVLLGSCQEASFEVSNLIIEPASALAGETIAVSVDVSNTGGAEGIYDVILKVNGEQVANELVALAGEDSKTVTLELTAGNPGEYEVQVAELSDVLHVVDLDGILAKAIEAINDVHSYHFTCTLDIEMSIPEDSMSLFDEFEEIQ
jgi:formate-dependent phosphoribosylglycinamide formyltransferase (GAR transformylase)